MWPLLTSTISTRTDSVPKSKPMEYFATRRMVTRSELHVERAPEGHRKRRGGENATHLRIAHAATPSATTANTIDAHMICLRFRSDSCAACSAAALRAASRFADLTRFSMHGWQIRRP